MGKHHRHGVMALQDMIYQRLVSAEKPVTMAELQALARKNGFTAGIVRDILHRLAQKGLVLYVADPTAVSVMAVEVQV